LKNLGFALAPPKRGHIYGGQVGKDYQKGNYSLFGNEREMRRIRI
jgi:hypothetical protein